MIGCKACPDVVPDDSHLASRILLAAPHAIGQVSADFVEEIGLVHCIILKQELLLSLVLTVSEVGVAGEGEAPVAGEAAEGDVAFDFVVLGQFEGAMGANLAIVLDGHDGV